MENNKAIQNNIGTHDRKRHGKVVAKVQETKSRDDGENIYSFHNIIDIHTYMVALYKTLLSKHKWAFYDSDQKQCNTERSLNVYRSVVVVSLDLMVQLVHFPTAR